MLGKTLFFGAIFGGVLYALLKTQRKVIEERAQHLEASSRWEDEGGAAIPTDESLAGAPA